MSIHDFPKCVMVNDSNIPISKRIHSGVKKQKGCAQLPELQKYIETIIKASNEVDSEDTSVSEKDKFPKERKFGRQTVYKGYDNKIKHEKVKFDFNSNKRKLNAKAKAPFSEAVSSDVEIFSKFVPEFEDPRNWKLGKTQNSGSSLELESCLKKLYPNPYHLGNINEFQNLKTRLNLKKVDKDDIKDKTLIDAVSPKGDSESAVDSKKEKVLVSTHSEIKIKEKESNPIEPDPALSLKKFNPSSHSVKVNEEIKSSEQSNISKNSFAAKSSNSTCTMSSRVSSLESINEMLCKNSSTSVKKKKNLKEKKISLKDSIQKLKAKSNDYDIGKLTLLNISDSDESTSKKLQEEQNIIKNDDFVADQSSDEAYPNKDFKDLLKIYEVMNKATESFLLLSSQSKCNETELEISNTMKEDETLLELLNEAKVRSDGLQNKEELKCSDEQKDENNKKNETESSVVDSKSEDEDKSLLNFLLREENFDYKNDSEEKDTKTNSESANDKTDLFQNEENEKKLETLIESEQKTENEVNDTNEKIDDVLLFMYNRLKKINSQEKFGQEKGKNIGQEVKKEIKTTTSFKSLKENLKDPKQEGTKITQSRRKTLSIPKENEFSESLLIKNFSKIKEQQNKCSTMLAETSRKPIQRVIGRRKPETVIFSVEETEREASILELSNRNLGGGGGIPQPVDLSVPIALFADSFEVNEDFIHTVESQNELGGFTEESQGVIMDSEERVLKSVLPLTAKPKKSKTSIYKTLKDVLENEERLMADKTILEEVESDEKNSLETTSNHTLMMREAASACSMVETFKKPNSNFVICVNTFPRNLRTTTTIRPAMSVASSPIFLAGDAVTSNLMPMTYYPKFRSSKVSITFEPECNTVECRYNFRQENLLILNKSSLAYTAIPVGVIVTINFKNWEECSVSKSQCQIQILEAQKPMATKFSKTNEWCTQTITTNKSNSMPSIESGVATKKENEKPVEALIEAIEETEEKVFLLEQTNFSRENLSRNSQSLCSCSVSECTKNETIETDLEKENEKKKVQNLLLRTYHLQEKLHRYLFKISFLQTTYSPQPLIQTEQFMDFGVYIKDKNDLPEQSVDELEVKGENSLPLVHWYLQPPLFEKASKTDKSVSIKTEMINVSTSCNPSVEEKSESTTEKSEDLSYENLTSGQKDEETYVNQDNDDTSSTYSFKSSNDFSESNDSPNFTKESKDTTNGEFFKKLFNKIESFKQSFDADKFRNRETNTSSEGDHEELNLEEEPNENKMVEYDPKTPAKVLKTVFKGKKSSTELTIGLKDVPMTKVSNISVEKTKFSPNHTKISICISKEKPKEFRQEKKGNEVVQKNYPSYFDRMRSSLSTCQTDYSRIQDEVSKSSQSANQESEDNEDDFKSADSTIDNSETDANQVKTKPEDQKAEEVSPLKTHTKHKFDFYRKMDMNLDSINAKQKSLTSTLCSYKELEPLKQALTKMQIRMRSIKRDAVLSSNDYYEKALKLAKMSAGYCQSCGTRAVIPDDTFGYYKTLLPRRFTHHSRNRYLRAITPNSSFYSFRTSNPEVGDQFCDFDIKQGTSYLLNRTGHSNRAVLRSSLHDMPILFERI